MLSPYDGAGPFIGPLIDSNNLLNNFFLSTPVKNTLFSALFVCSATRACLKKFHVYNTSLYSRSTLVNDLLFDIYVARSVPEYTCIHV